jgi:hypothetical protein
MHNIKLAAASGGALVAFAAVMFATSVRHAHADDLHQGPWMNLIALNEQAFWNQLNKYIEKATVEHCASIAVGNKPEHCGDDWPSVGRQITLS